MPSMKGNVLDSKNVPNSTSTSIIPRLDSLPPELLQQIVSISESRAKSILCLICKSISTISNEILYRTVLLNSSSKVRLLAKSLNNQSSSSSSNASRSKCKDEDAAYQSDLPNLYHLLIASQDGLMSPNETITIQKEWSPSLKSIFTSDNSLTLRTVALISRPSGAALESFLSKHTRARPHNVSIYRLSVSTPPFSILDLNPLSQVTHFNLVQILPTEPLLDFFKCKPSTHDSQSQELLHSQQPHHHPLTHLRLSEVDPQCLLDFGDYINWRKAFDLWELQQKTSSSSSEAPKAPLVPSRRFSSQESLFSLASTIPHLLDFKLLMIEITKLPSLEKPSGLNLETGEESGDNGSLQTMDWSSNLPASLQEERDWREREERNRTWERDLFWLKLREGLVELKGLIQENSREFKKKNKREGKWDDQDEIREAQDVGNDDKEDQVIEQSEIEVRLVIPKARGWVEDEIIKDFQSQTFEREAFEFQTQFNKGDHPDSLFSSSKVEFGCWRDQDIFEISQNRPWLSYAAKDQDESDYARGGKEKDDGEERDELGTNLKDWRRKGDQSWWTGELPRMDAGRERTPFDFQS